jgi:hypothetical protein
MRSIKSAVIMCVLVSFIAIGCKTENVPGDQQKAQNQKKQASVQGLMAKQPLDPPDFSMDRYLLNQRLNRFNDPNKMSYLYVFTPAGPIIQFTIMGKVASTSKRLTMPVQKYKLDKGPHYEQDLGPAPDEMGVYGSSSGSAKVGMTTIGSLVEFGGFGFYIYSEIPLSFQGLEQPIININLEADGAEKEALLEKLNAVQAEAKR